MGLARPLGAETPFMTCHLRSHRSFKVKGRAMTNAEEARASNTDQDARKPLWERRDEERRRLGPSLSDAQLDELQALFHQL